MKVVIACDSYKGCMTSREVARRIEEGIRQGGMFTREQAEQLIDRKLEELEKDHE